MDVTLEVDVPTRDLAIGLSEIALLGPGISARELAWRVHHHYASLPPSTLRRWLLDNSFATEGPDGRLRPTQTTLDIAAVMR